MTIEPNNTVRIPEFPEAYTRNQLTDICEALGLDANYIHSIYVNAKYVRVTMCAIHSGGEGRVLAGEESLKFEANIPVFHNKKAE